MVAWVGTKVPRYNSEISDEAEAERARPDKVTEGRLVCMLSIARGCVVRPAPC